MKTIQVTTCKKETLMFHEQENGSFRRTDEDMKNKKVVAIKRPFDVYLRRARKSVDKLIIEPHKEVPNQYDIIMVIERRQFPAGDLGELEISDEVQVGTVLWEIKGEEIIDLGEIIRIEYVD